MKSSNPVMLALRILMPRPASTDPNHDGFSVSALALCDTCNIGQSEGLIYQHCVQNGLNSIIQMCAHAVEESLIIHFCFIWPHFVHLLNT